MVSGRSGMARSYRLRSPLAPPFIGSGRYEGRQLKAKEFIYLLGLKPKPKTFGFVIEAHDLPREGRIEVARWLHPGAYPIAPLQVQAAVDQLRRFLRPGDVAIDIGAHTGDTTLPIALAVGATGRVLGLERSEEHTSELQSQSNLVCRLLLEKKKRLEYLLQSHAAICSVCQRRHHPIYISPVLFQ